MDNATAKHINNCESSNLQRLHEYLSKYPEAGVVLFIGAGVNYGLIPTWKDLLSKLLETALMLQFRRSVDPNKDLHYRWICNELDVYDRASLIRQLLDKQYLYYLHKALYSGLRQLPKDGTLYRVAQLCLKKRLHAVVTYNYDNLLEYMINDEKKDYAVPIYGKRQKYTSNNTLPIYHVHGYLPWKEKLGDADEHQVVLARPEYYDQMIQPYTWQTTVQLNFLRRNICIYLGTSMTDMNMLRLAHHALRYVKRPQIYVIDAKEFYFSRMKEKNKYTEDDRDNTEAKEQILRLQAALLDKIDIRMIMAEDTKQYYTFLEKLKDKLNKES